MNLKRFLAVVKARNIEFFRDKSSLGWSLAFPILLLVGMSFVFSGEGKAAYKIGILNLSQVQSTFLDTKFIDFIDYQDSELAKRK
ncbi:MAG: ABC transporter permease, partial [Colwelliaceae bacterium]|nr:ABC transporter permease [Colwelliaceae bacterium]